MQAPPFIVGSLQGIGETSCDICAALPGEVLRATRTVKVILGIRVEREWMPGKEPEKQEDCSERAALSGTGLAVAQMSGHRTR